MPDVALTVIEVGEGLKEGLTWKLRHPDSVARPEDIGLVQSRNGDTQTQMHRVPKYPRNDRQSQVP